MAPLDDATAERFDPTMLHVAQQIAAMANGEDAINMMLDLYFGFLRRKTDFFASEKCKEAVLAAYQRQATIVEKANKGKAAEKLKASEKAGKAMEERLAREAAVEQQMRDEDDARKSRLKQAELDRKL
eukprot:CAMPEP_0197606060 /NCGR_PEP_ID=MMETSP1326-20131121/44281_1 /TAXON_ID=1155430 /ORGANISM="Genus nov. species nov., Strain RCC2288" /LENGTH=127 /DNA_ID=CAMNT_0043173917 /DNA_START=80 /DNA_END=459 /DNA_ORIENTATION=-